MIFCAGEISKKIAKDLGNLEFLMRRQLSELFAQRTEGENIGMPVSRPMTVIKNGLRNRLTPLKSDQQYGHLASRPFEIERQLSDGSAY